MRVRADGKGGRRPARPTALLLAAALAALAGGCGASAPAEPDENPGAADETPATRPGPVIPNVPDEVTGGEETGAGMEIVVTDPDLERKDEAYQVAPKIPSGRLVGACAWAGDVIDPRKLPPAEPVDFDDAGAIVKPVKGEVPYYRNLGLKRRRYLGSYRGFYPTGVILALRGIKGGRREMFPRANFMVREGRFKPHMQFGPIHERVMLGTYDSYPTHVLMTSLGSREVVLDGEIAAFDRDTIKPLGGGGVHYTRRPKMQQSEVIHELGPCAIRGRRHTWKSAYLFIVDNPYAVVVDRGAFTMDHVPVGTWTVQVWHPEFTPVKGTCRVTIEKDRTTELRVEFRPPAAIRAKPAEKKK